VFAGAAREAVFSNPDVIRKINADFVPVALKAGLVNMPPSNEEGQLYREIARSKPAPQGICVVNPAGKVMAWSLMFDDDKSVLAFLDYAQKRFRDFPGSTRPVAAERFMRYPSQKLADTPDTGVTLSTADRHATGASCPARLQFPAGTIAARVIGRALGADGKPVADTVRQEHYLEDRFEIPLSMQDALAQRAATAGANRFALPDEFTRALVSHAYLGQLDVNPLGSPAGGITETKRWELWAQRDSSNTTQFRLEGTSEISGGEARRAGPARPDGRSDGRQWEHSVKLTWDGFIDLKANRITRVLLTARGSEKLKWGNAFFTGVADVTRLPGGHPIDLACGVKYGIIGEPVAGDEVGIPNQPSPLLPSPNGRRSDGDADPARHLIGAFGPQFVIFLSAVQADLRVNDQQKQALEEMKSGVTGGFQQFNLVLENSPPEQRGPKLQQFREEANRMVGNVLGQLLNAEQQKRLRQIMLQQEGLLALGNPEVAGELKLTDEQKTKFSFVVREMQKGFEAVQQSAASGGDPRTVMQEAMKLRKGHESKIDALLTDAQKQQWKTMLGKPIEIGI